MTVAAWARVGSAFISQESLTDEFANGSAPDFREGFYRPQKMPSQMPSHVPRMFAVSLASGSI